MSAFLISISAILIMLVLAPVAAFQTASVPSLAIPHRQPTTAHRMAVDETSADSEVESVDVESFIADNYPEFHSLLSKNPGIWKEMSEASNGYTIFAPNSQAFEDLGDKKRRQIEDPRNLETAQKLGLYHVVSVEPVSSMRLRTEDWTKPRPKDGSPQPLTIGGIVTLGGEVAVGRKKSGGFLGFGAKEDGSIVVGPEAQIVQSNNVGSSIVHEVDAFISPIVLWRYFDQLQIGSF